MMYFIYYGDAQDEFYYVASALILPVNLWASTYNHVRKFRQELQHRYGIPLYQQLTPGKFVAGRGRFANQVLSREQRCAIFKQLLQLMTELPQARLVNVALPIYRTRPLAPLPSSLQELIERSPFIQAEELQAAQGNDARLAELIQLRAAEWQAKWESLMQHFRQKLQQDRAVQESMIHLLGYRSPHRVTIRLGYNLLQGTINQVLASWNSYGILIFPHHVGPAIKKQAKLHYEVGIERRLIEDQFIKSPQQSYFLQLASFSAYALLRKERPIPTQSKYGLDRAFDILSPLLVQEAKGHGILRLQHIWDNL